MLCVQVGEKTLNNFIVSCIDMNTIVILIVSLIIDTYLIVSLFYRKKSLKSWIRYTTLALISISILITWFYTAYENWADSDSIQNSPMIVVRSMLLIFWLCKLPLAGIFFVDDLTQLIRNHFEMVDSQKDLKRRKFLGQMGLLTAGIPFATLFYGKLRNTYRYKLYKESIAIKNLPPELEGFKIIQLSDIHSGSFFFKSPIEKAVEIVNQEKPDIVFFTGDLVNEKAKETNLIFDSLKQIEGRLGIFSVLGNHDYGDYGRWNNQQEKDANFEAILQVHQKLGWQLLLNEHKVVNVGNAKLGIIGVENFSVYDRFPTHGDLKKASRNMEACDVKILLSHDPSHWDAEVITQHKDIDLTLSGHTHGSQFGIEIPGWFKLSPVQLLYKQWAGLYKKQNQYLYVNRGLGYIGYVGRVGILPEISILKLTALEE